MTSANVFNWTAVKSGQTLNANAKASGSKAGNVQTSVFASMMNANYSAGMGTAKGAGVREAWSRPVNASKQAAVYDRYQYQDKPIAAAGTAVLSDKLEAAEEELAGFEEEVTAMVAEKLGLTEDEVVQAMEDLGLTAFDLLDVQKLIQLTAALTGASDTAELLVNPQFQDLMQTMQTMGRELMAELNLPMDQMDELIAQMDALETPVELPEAESVEAEAAESAKDTDAGADAKSIPEDGTEAPEKAAVTAETAGNKPEETAGMKSEEKAAVQPEETAETKPEETAEAQTQKVQEEPQADLKNESDAEEPAAAAADKQKMQEEPQTDLKDESDAEEPAHAAAVRTVKEDAKESGDAQSAFAGRRENGARAARPTAGNEPVPGVQNVFHDVKAQMVSQLSEMEGRYLSADTIDIMEQVVEKLKVTITEGLSSMEMTLNPENLGKVYLQISAREGAVHAQIAAANEAVKNVLEAQVAEIQEHLNQAGVKVEAIDVTVAAHEFERNLEQNQKREEQEGEQAQQNGRRRNLNLTSLDELSSVMTEEEMLVAQIMRDNGNSVDLSA